MTLEHKTKGIKGILEKNVADDFKKLFDSLRRDGKHGKALALLMGFSDINEEVFSTIPINGKTKKIKEEISKMGDEDYELIEEGKGFRVYKKDTIEGNESVVSIECYDNEMRKKEIQDFISDTKMREAYRRALYNRFIKDFLEKKK